jgi:tripartite-type tricarboxylate transporter receptor subunit TctC
MIVPFAIGGGTDIVARAVALKIGDAFGQSVVVDNKTGANGNIGMELAAKARPMATRIIMTSSALAINPSMYKGMGYDAVNDFCAGVARHADPVHTRRELRRCRSTRSRSWSHSRAPAKKN